MEAMVARTGSSSAEGLDLRYCIWLEYPKGFPDRLAVAFDGKKEGGED